MYQRFCVLQNSIVHDLFLNQVDILLVLQCNCISSFVVFSMKIRRSACQNSSWETKIVIDHFQQWRRYAIAIATFFPTFLSHSLLFVICYLKKNFCHGEIRTWQLLGNGIEWSIVSAELRNATLNDSLFHLAFITIGYSYSFAQITKINEFFKSTRINGHILE